MKTNFRRHRLATLIGTFFFSASAFAYTVDGNLGDWGINSSTWAPAAGVSYITADGIRGMTAGTTPLGGQPYDVEAMYGNIVGNTLYLAMITGHNPMNTAYAQGDFGFDFGKNGSYDVGLNVVSGPSTGLGLGADSLTVRGGVYNNTTWGTANGVKTYMSSGTLIGTGSLAYTTTAVTGYGSTPTDTHYIYEASVDLSLLTASGWDGQAFNVGWAMNCGNDYIRLGVETSTVPEPTSLLLMATALLGLGGLRRREKR